MSIDDKMEKLLLDLAQETSSPSEKDMRRFVQDATLGRIPVIGGPLTNLLAGKAQQRIFDRVIELFEEIKRRIEDLDEDGKRHLDSSYFESEEFQTLLALAFQQLQTSHDQERLSQLAAALVNSGRVEFASEERKELFVRLLQDLMPQHIRMLDQLRRSGIKNPRVEQKLLLQTLYSHGLVEDVLKKDRVESHLTISRFQSETQARHAMSEVLKGVNEPPDRYFKISSMGLDFLAYIGAEAYTDHDV